MLGLNVDSDVFSFMVGKRVCSISQVGTSTMIYIEFDCMNLNVECFWRLRESNRMIITSEDKMSSDYEWSKDPIIEIQQKLTEKRIRSCHLVKDTEDLFIQYENDIWLDVIRDNTMYESWHIDAGDRGFFVGG